MKDLIHAAITGAVNESSDKPVDVKNDIIAHLFESVFSTEEFQNMAEKVKGMITDLGNQFEKMSLNDSRLAGYLLQNLDLPRNNVSTDAVNDLIHLSNESNAGGDDVAVVASKLGLDTLPNSGVVVKREGDDANGAITHTVSYIKTSDKKMLLFVLTQGIESYLVTRAGTNLLVEKQEGYTVTELGKTLESIRETEFAPALMSDREIITVDDLDTDWMDGYLNDNPDVLNDEQNRHPNQLLDVIVNSYVKMNELDVSDKRLELTYHDELLERAQTLIAGLNTPNDEPTVEEGPVDLGTPGDPVIEDAEIIEEDSSLFSEGVVEQSEETTTPVVDDNFDMNLFEDDGIDDADDYNTTDSTSEVAIRLLNELGDNPEKGLDIIQHSSLTIKDSLYREVFNTLPSVQKRSSGSYSDTEREDITTALDGVYREVLKRIDAHRAKTEQERLDALTYNVDTVKDIIVESPVHSHLLTEDSVRDDVASAVTRYLNDNDRGETTDATSRVQEVLRNLSMYDYETESLINSTYRVTNVPPADKLIRGTPVISTTLRKLYTSKNDFSEESKTLVDNNLAKVASGELSGLDVPTNVVEALVQSKFQPKEFTRIGNFIVANVPVKSSDEAACICFMTGASAWILNIDKTRNVVVGFSEITKANQRGDLINLLMYR